MVRSVQYFRDLFITDFEVTQAVCEDLFDTLKASGGEVLESNGTIGPVADASLPFISLGVVDTANNEEVLILPRLVILEIDVTTDFTPDVNPALLSCGQGDSLISNLFNFDRSTGKTIYVFNQLTHSQGIITQKIQSDLNIYISETIAAGAGTWKATSIFDKIIVDIANLPKLGEVGVGTPSTPPPAQS